MDKKEEAAYNDVEQYLEECEYKKTALKLIHQVYITNIILENLNKEKNYVDRAIYKELCDNDNIDMASFNMG